MNRPVAILGATGLVGRTMLHLLEERRFPCASPRLLASDRPTARTLAHRGRELPVEPVGEDAFEGIELALFASANPVSERWAPVARAAGARVVDNSSAFRYVDEVPLVVPEVNGVLLDCGPTLVANPNCSTIAIVMALAPLARITRLESVEVATYQSASGGGSEVLEELELGIRAGLDGTPPRRRDGGPPFAYNVVPQIDRFESNGYTREEMKVMWETRKILALPELLVNCTAVRVPVRVGHGAHVSVVLDRAVSPDEARGVWSASPGLIVVDEPLAGRYPTPLEAAGRDEVLVGRARTSLTHPRGLTFFVASDNLRKGAATNAVQIAEHLAGLGAGVAR
ncbi:MAG: aspartate-semialdehyde dehydrogenase [Candidatus Eisenbacteria bacterium]